MLHSRPPGKIVIHYRCCKQQFRKKDVHSKRLLLPVRWMSSVCQSASCHWTIGGSAPAGERWVGGLTRGKTESSTCCCRVSSKSSCWHSNCSNALNSRSSKSCVVTSSCGSTSMRNNISSTGERGSCLQGPVLSKDTQSRSTDTEAKMAKMGAAEDENIHRRGSSHVQASGATSKTISEEVKSEAVASTQGPKTRRAADTDFMEETALINLVPAAKVRGHGRGHSRVGKEVLRLVANLSWAGWSCEPAHPFSWPCFSALASVVLRDVWHICI